jgi:hypothetical protein
MIEIITLAIITGLSGFAFGYLTKSHNESGWKQMYLYEQKKRVLAEESRDEVHAYAMRLENRLIAQQKDLESLQGVVEMQTGKSRLVDNVEKQK